MVFLLPDSDGKNSRDLQGVKLKPIFISSNRACKPPQLPSFHLQFGRDHASIFTTIVHLLVKYSHIKYDYKYCLWKPDKRGSESQYKFANLCLQIFSLVFIQFRWERSASPKASTPEVKWLV